MIVGDDMPYTFAEDNYLEFVFDKSIQLSDILECRYGIYPEEHRYPSVACDFDSGDPNYNKVTMRLHPLLDIEANTKYTVIIDTRN